MTITDLSTYHPVFLLKRLSTIPFIPGKKKKKTIRSIRPAIGIGEDYDQQHANYNGRWRQLLNDLNQQHSQFYIFKKSYHPWLQLLPNKNPDFFPIHPSFVQKKKRHFPPISPGKTPRVDWLRIPRSECLDGFGSSVETVVRGGSKSPLRGCPGTSDQWIIRIPIFFRRLYFFVTQNRWNKATYYITRYEVRSLPAGHHSNKNSCLKQWVFVVTYIHTVYNAWKTSCC